MISFCIAADVMLKDFKKLKKRSYALVIATFLESLGHIFPLLAYSELDCFFLG